MSAGRTSFKHHYAFVMQEQRIVDLAANGYTNDSKSFQDRFTAIGFLKIGDQPKDLEMLID